MYLRASSLPCRVDTLAPSSARTKLLFSPPVLPSSAAQVRPTVYLLHLLHLLHTHTHTPPAAFQSQRRGPSLSVYPQKRRLCELRVRETGSTLRHRCVRACRGCRRAGSRQGLGVLFSTACRAVWGLESNAGVEGTVESVRSRVGYRRCGPKWRGLQGAGW